MTSRQTAETPRGGGRAKLPPVAELGTATLALIVVGGIYLAAYLPRHAPLGVPIGLLCGAGVLIAANLVLLFGLRAAPFAWGTFFKVARWALLAYCVVAGMLEYVFVFDGTRGAVLAVLTVMLVVFATIVPTIIAFTVARYEVVMEAAPAG
jgi:hypothetical protein